MLATGICTMVLQLSTGAASPFISTTITPVSLLVEGTGSTGKFCFFDRAPAFPVSPLAAKGSLALLL
jgi:hypothetical protein